jgi:hypothetical protein
VKITINSEWYHWKLNGVLETGATSLGEIIRVALDDPFNNRAYRRGGTDKRIPGLRWRDEITAQRIDDPIRGNSVGKTAETVIPLISEAPVPCLVLETWARHENRANLAQDPRVQWASPDRFAPSGIKRPGNIPEVLEMRLGRGHRDEPVHPGVINEAFQEAGAGGMPPFNLFPIRLVTVGVVVDRAIRSWGHSRDDQT